jgi:hypothetical protein
MQKEMIYFIREYGLSPFNKTKTLIRNSKDSIFKTKDAKDIHTKVLQEISKNFRFADTSNLFYFFPLTQYINEIKARQEYFSSIKSLGECAFLKDIKPLKKSWKPKYDVVVVTSDETTFIELKKIGCPVQYIISEQEVISLENYDVVQVIDADDFKIMLEQLPQSVFLHSLDEAYLERYVELLSGWKENIEILHNNYSDEKIKGIVEELMRLFDLMKSKPSEFVSKENVERAVDDINDKISEKMQNLTISGNSLFSLLSKDKLPKQVEEIIEKTISDSGLNENLFKTGIPVEIDEEELDKLLKQQSAEEFTGIAEKIRAKSSELQSLPDKLEELKDKILLLDFESGISEFMKKCSSFPIIGEDLSVENSSNLFLNNPQKISFHLNNNHKCSILTGANSGGKTTLLEHLIQIISLSQIGLPVSGIARIPLFNEVYYFAKNKGSMSKGAFETLLTQMSGINPGNNTMILADEIEAVTEPGVAGNIVCATADYFVNKGCYMIIATHLGQEIQKSLPGLTRIDGIEAKGLDEKFELIVDHNPVLGRLAHSTPELIVERMANAHDSEYFRHVWKWLKKI